MNYVEIHRVLLAKSVADCITKTTLGKWIQATISKLYNLLNSLAHPSPRAHPGKTTVMEGGREEQVLEKKTTVAMLLSDGLITQSENQCMQQQEQNG